jgi:hypothetical protein
LTSITIGNGIKKIYSEAFANCEMLTDVYCYAESVPTTASDAFKGVNIGNATLHVPSSSVNLYKETAPWSGFKDVVAIGDVDGDGVVDVNDVQTIINIILKKSSGQGLKGDVDGDGVVDVNDVQTTINIILKK